MTVRQQLSWKDTKDILCFAISNKQLIMPFAMTRGDHVFSNFLIHYLLQCLLNYRSIYTPQSHRGLVDVMSHIEVDTLSTSSYLRTPKYATIMNMIMVDISIVAKIIAELPRNIKIENSVIFFFLNSNTLRSI